MAFTLKKHCSAWSFLMHQEGTISASVYLTMGVPFVDGVWSTTSLSTGEPGSEARRRPAERNETKTIMSQISNGVIPIVLFSRLRKGNIIDGPTTAKIEDAGPARRAFHRSFCIALAATGLLFVLMIVTPAYSAEPAGLALSAGMQSGMVTAVHVQTVEINGKEFGFSPKVVVWDHKGQKVELSYIIWNSEVQYRVMKDDIRRIDRIIVQQPE